MYQCSLERMADKIRTFAKYGDAGHGGIDGGATAVDGTLEKDINLSIAHKVNDLLTLFGINTVMTRECDMSIHSSDAETVRQKKVSDIKNRLKIINDAKNPVFVSIHQNHFTQSKYTGTQVFYSPNNERSRALAQIIQEDIVSSLQPDNTRQIKKSGTQIYLLYHAPCPAVMIECGFLSNESETELLKCDEYQTKIAAITANSILKFISDSSEVL